MVSLLDCEAKARDIIVITEIEVGNSDNRGRAMKPSLMGIGCKLTAAKRMAELLGESSPEQQPALTEFVATVNHLWKELFDSYYPRQTATQDRHDGCDYLHP